MANWTEEEIIIVCAELKANDWEPYRAHSAEAQALSALLQKADFVAAGRRGSNFRSPGNVQRKMYDLQTLMPGYVGKPTKGGRTTREVLEAFLADADEMDHRATRLRAAIGAHDDPTPDVEKTIDVDWSSDGDEFDPDFAAFEGTAVLVQHLRRERNPKIRNSKIAAVKESGLPIACEVCAFDFADAYGDLGDGYIEVHHVLPLHASGPTRTRLQDLALLCSNCHRMIHRARPWITPAELRDRLSH